MAEPSGSPSIPMKEVMQARPKRGVVIEPLESTDDSDEEPPLKRNLHCKYRLRFVDKVREHSGTLEPVKADDGDDLKVALFDENNMRITSGPLSSASVVVSALQGDFNAGGEDYWTSDEFSRCKEAGLQVQGGDCILQLADGEACLSGAVFHRTGKFRIGVMMASSPLPDERILEAISEPVLIYKMSTPLLKFRSTAMVVLFFVKLLQRKTKAAHLKLNHKLTVSMTKNSSGGFFVPRDTRMYETSMPILNFRRTALAVSFIVKLQAKIKAPHLKQEELMDKKTVQDERIPEEMSGSFFVMDDHGKDQAIGHLTRMFAHWGLDPDLVEDKDFRSFASCLNAEFKMPSPSAMGKAVRNLVESDNFSDNFAESSPDVNRPIREDQISETLMIDYPGCTSSAVDSNDGADSGALDEAASDQFARQSDSKVNTRSRRRSSMWDLFTLVTDLGGNGKWIICKFCNKELRADTRTGTSHLGKHARRCSTQKEVEAALKSRFLSPEPPCPSSGLGTILEENKESE